MFYDLNDYFDADGIIGKRDIAVALFNELTDHRFGLDINIELYILKRKPFTNKAPRAIIAKKVSNKERLKVVA